MLFGSAALLLWTGEIIPCSNAASCEPKVSAAGFVGGSLLGVVFFGLFMALDNRRRATKRYRDWRPSPRGLIPWTTALGWALGIVHAFGLALYLTRLL